MKWKLLIGLILSYFVYLLVGGAIFMAIERPAESRSCKEASDMIASIFEGNRSDSSYITLGALQNLSKILRNEAQYGVSVDIDTREVTCTHNWDFQSAFFFCGTVVTTIGYGNISPSTSGGRIFCIFYALLGIPLFALMFSGLGEKIADLVKRLDARVMGRAKRSWVGKTLVGIIVAASLCILCLIIPAVIFMAVEKWSYRDSFYYAFITLTTIGFGDFVVGTNPDIEYIAIYRVLVYFWILFGLAFMATAISLISGFMKQTGEKATSRIDSTNNEIDGADAEDAQERGDGDGGSKAEEDDNAFDEVATALQRKTSQDDREHEEAAETPKPSETNQGNQE